MAKSGGFSKADVQILVETNLQQVSKDTAQTNQRLDDMSKILSVLNKHVNGLNRNMKAQAKVLSESTKHLANMEAYGRGTYNELTKVNKATKNVQKNSRGVISKMRDWLVIIGQIRSAFLNIKMLTTDVFGYILKVGSKFEKLEVLLSGLSKESNTEKRIDDVRKKIDYLIDTAKNAPFSLDAIQDAFVKLDTVGLQPTEGSLQGLIDAVSAFGGGEEHIKRAAIALQQMAGKGVVSMEELRQQLGESVPTALQMMAKGAGISIGELVKHISKGTVEAKTAIQIMNREFVIAYSGASEKLMETGEGLVSRIKTLILTLSRDMAEQSGVYDEFKNVLKELVEYLGSPEATQNAIELGVTLKNILNVVTALTKALYQMKTFLSWLIGFLSIKTILGKLLVSMSATTKSFVKLGIKAGYTKGVLKGFYGVLNKLAIFLKSNWVVAGLAAIATIALKIADNMAQASHNADVLHTSLLKVKNAKNAGVTLDENDIDYDTGSLKFTRRQKSETAEKIRLLESHVALQKNLMKQYSHPSMKVYYDEANESLQAANKQLGLEREKLEGIAQVLDILEQKHTEYKISQNEHIKSIVDVYELRKNQLMEEYRAREEEINKIQDEYIREKEIAKERTKYAGLIGDAFYQLAETLGNINGEAREELAIQKLIFELAKKRQELQNALNDSTKLKFLDAENDIANIQKQIESDMKKLAKLKSQLEDGGVYTNFAKSSQINKVEEDYNKFLKANKYEEKNAEQRLKIQESYWSKLHKQIQATNAAVERNKTTVEGAQKASQRSINKLNEEYEKYDRMLASARENLAKGVEPLTQTVTLESRLAAELNNVADANKKAALEDKNRKAVENERLARSLNSLYDLEQENARISAELYADKTDDLDSYLAYHSKKIKEELQMDIGTEEERARKLEAYNEARKLREEEWRANHKTDLEKTFDEWGNFGRQLDSVWSDAFENMADALCDFLETGEFNFREFANSVMKEITRITIKAAMSKVFSSLTGGGGETDIWGNVLNLATSLGGLFGGGGTKPSDTGSYSGVMAGDMKANQNQMLWDSVKATYHHTGGIVGAGYARTAFVSPEMFVGAHKYHTGGIAGLKPDETPAILKNGEGVFTKEQMKALGANGAQQANVTVNVINNTQDDVTSEQSKPRFDGEQLILDVVLKNMNQPGSFRNSMLGMTK